LFCLFSFFNAGPRKTDSLTAFDVQFGNRSEKRDDVVLLGSANVRPLQYVQTDSGGLQLCKLHRYDANFGFV
jgi:hypothetical protein